MRSDFVYKFKYLPFILILLFITACEPSIQATTTPTAQPTLAQPTATLTNSLIPEPTITPTPTSTPLPKIDLDIELPEGDPESGYLTAIRYRCHGCHANELHPTSGPRFTSDGELPFVLERGIMRIKASDYEGRATNNQEYMIESIFQPEAYIVPGDWEESMPTTFQQRISDQE
ncbi:MAG: hypothetical protein WBL25_21190, partial [Anaerolineales bacterium]